MSFWLSILIPISRQQKTRPALVVQADNLNTGLAQSVLAMISSNMARSGHPSRVVIRLATASGQKTGLRTDSVVMTDNLRTVLHTQIDRVIGSWDDMATVDAALRHSLGM